MTLSKLETSEKKIDLIDEENSRLILILHFAYKNPAKNDMWQKGLEIALSNITALILMRKGLLEGCINEAKQIEEDCKEIKFYRD